MSCETWEEIWTEICNQMVAFYKFLAHSSEILQEIWFSMFCQNITFHFDVKNYSHNYWHKNLHSQMLVIKIVLNMFLQFSII